MKERLVIVTVETLLELFKDYLGEEYIPKDARVEQFMYKPTEQGKFAMVIVSPSIRAGAKPVEVKFDMKRVYTIGEKNE